MEPTLPTSQLPTASQGEPDERQRTVAPAEPSAMVATPSAFENAVPDESGVEGESQQPNIVQPLLTRDQLPASPSSLSDSIAELSTKAVGSRSAAMGSPPGSPAGAAAPSQASMEADAKPQPSMKDLFGPFFGIERLPEKVADPALVDTRSVLQEFFGPHASEKDIMFEFEKELAERMSENVAAYHQANVQQLFGESAVQVLREENVEAFTLLHSTAPVNTGIAAEADLDGDTTAPALKDNAHKNLWLMEMPKMHPNRQTLHADPQPFFPAECAILESDDRYLYTPQNVMRWAHHKGSNTYMSNARVVRWSDGSVTLHVGSDIFSLEGTKSNAAAHLLGTETVVSKGDAEMTSITTTVKPSQHFVVESTEAASIERAVFAEAQHQEAKAAQLKLAYATATLPDVNWAKPNAARNPQEEYVAMEYEQRKKKIARRQKEGRPMTLREQLEEDLLLHQQLSNANVEDLIEQQKEERRQAALNTAARRAADGPRAGGRSRLDRRMGLSALDGTADPFMDYGSNGSRDDDDEDDAARDASGESEDDIEALMDRMRNKREREAAASNGGPAAQRARTEGDDNHAKYAPLVAALEKALATIPTDTESYGEVEGMVTYMKSKDFSPAALEPEVRSLATAISASVPQSDFSAVWEEFNKLF